MRVGGRIDVSECCACVPRLANLHFVTGSVSAEDQVIGDIGPAIVRCFPSKKRLRSASCAGEAGRLRRDRFGGIRIERREYWFTAGLSRDAHVRGEVVRRGARDAACAYTTIAEAIERPALCVDGDFVEVEKIPVIMAATLLPDTGHALHWVVRRGIDRRPSLPVVVGSGDKGIPFAGEATGLVIARHVCANETYGRPTG